MEPPADQVSRSGRAQLWVLGSAKVHRGFVFVLHDFAPSLMSQLPEDFVAAGFPNRPYPEDSGIPYTNLSPAREATWQTEARKAIKEAARSFRGQRDGHARSGPVLLWRSLHHPPRHNYAPFPVGPLSQPFPRRSLTSLSSSIASVCPRLTCA